MNVEAFNREGEEVTGTVELRQLKVSFEEAVAPRVLPSDPAIRAGEAERAAKHERPHERTLPGRVTARGMCLGVNLAWPTARSPVGEDMQLYGRILDGGDRWFDRRWDIGEEAVASSVRKDFQDIRALFGEGRGGAAVAVRRSAQRHHLRRSRRSRWRSRPGPRRTWARC